MIIGSDNKIVFWDRGWGRGIEKEKAKASKVEAAVAIACERKRIKNNELPIPAVILPRRAPCLSRRARPLALQVRTYGTPTRKWRAQ